MNESLQNIPVACTSFAGFHEQSKIIQRFAPTRLIPIPPARVEINIKRAQSVTVILCSSSLLSIVLVFNLDFFLLFLPLSSLSSSSSSSSSLLLSALTPKSSSFEIIEDKAQNSSIQLFCTLNVLLPVELVLIELDERIEPLTLLKESSLDI
ncbi:hypothetical protein DERP_005294 [Dermatophagoides pteronyssinus]|uniref:Uncharacterized protein n=1 Tax=Dermatophagoides pteronyssinus TaxID=6956 RepID=A0ABQ8JM66_DERPT|nr:hypothetical protein DERP_005294 [Dermatophagoides pteronyssinus]